MHKLDSIKFKSEYVKCECCGKPTPKAFVERNNRGLGNHFVCNHCDGYYEKGRLLELINSKELHINKRTPNEHR